MELSRRSFLKGLGAIGLDALLARQHGAVVTGREGLVAWSRKNGILRPQWQGVEVKGTITVWESMTWRHTEHGWEKWIVDVICDCPSCRKRRGVGYNTDIDDLLSHVPEKCRQWLSEERDRGWIVVGDVVIAPWKPSMGLM